MPKRIIPLTDAKIKKAKPKNKNHSLFDGNGLYILITPSGGKLWRFKYNFKGIGRLLAFGSYPEISLLNAREKREEAHRQVSNGIDPWSVRKAQKQANANEGDTFENIAREWHANFKVNWVEKYSKKVLRSLEKDIFPYTGKEPIAELKAKDILAVLRIAESRGVLDAAHRLRSLCGQIFRYAVATGRAERDVTTDLKGALPKLRETHFAAITTPEEVAGLLRAIDSYKGSFIVQCALKLGALTFVRPGELRKGEWAEINFKDALWTIPREKMKMRNKSENDHVVPLSNQALEIFKQLYRLTVSGKYMFPSARSNDRPMSDNAVLAALRRMGFEKEEMSGHGFRAMARTIMDEVLHVRPDYIEHQLAHAVRDPNGRAYNRTAHLVERRKMMQQWADYLDEIKESGKVLQFKEPSPNI